MDRTRLSSKGQIIIPKAVRDAHGWTEGTEFTVEDTKGGLLLKPERRSELPKTTIDQVAGCLKYDGPPKTIEDMERGIDEAMRERWERKSK
jgi:AbrB family looped-hinge helix DNA binding protein